MRTLSFTLGRNLIQHRHEPIDLTEALDRAALIERFFSKLKPVRKVATRYDKPAENVLAMVQLASLGCGFAYEPGA
ncbi:DDE family transposase [Aminobacter aminovorans]|uniref:Transposase n=1 Tax=Aminobacter aminovorans TaxID=83263 RepID=A0A380WPR3_AMIAI|nr:DDE family transposase [Aminobacter aminovorans]SUU90838.1 Uncharacterised protein [Aminobacter aminovorans]